ncbi:hypothetical protein [Vulcanisaeta sp. EB80]|jgi:hypothetical protein|nr:hypothetical protein [Vulcanisaeta sp. EB80]
MQNRVPPYSIRADLLPALKGEAWHFVIKAFQFALAEFINEY